MIFHEIIFFSSDFHNLGINDFSWKQILFSLTSQIRAPSPQWKGQHKSFTRWHGGMKVQSGLHLCRHNIKQVARVCPPLRGLLQRDRQIVGVIPILLSKNSTERTTWNAAISLLFSLDPVCFFFSLYFAFYYFSLSIIIISYSSDPYLMSLFDEPESEEWKGYIVLYEQRFRAATMRDLCFAKFGRKFFSLTVLFLMCLFRWDAVCSW